MKKNCTDCKAPVSDEEFAFFDGMCEECHYEHGALLGDDGYADAPWDEDDEYLV